MDNGIALAITCLLLRDDGMIEKVAKVKRVLPDGSENDNIASCVGLFLAKIRYTLADLFRRLARPCEKQIASFQRLRCLRHGLGDA